MGGKLQAGGRTVGVNGGSACHARTAARLAHRMVNLWTGVRTVNGKVEHLARFAQNASDESISLEIHR